jgi:predicted transcriptional regulator
MPRNKMRRLGERQLEIMQVLWEQGEATVGGVHQTLGARRNLAYTTIATMLRKMEARHLVAHRLEGRTFIYRALVEEAAVSRRMADDVLDRLFAGSLADMVSCLLRAREVSGEELSRLERLIAERKTHP